MDREGSHKSPPPLEILVQSGCRRKERSYLQRQSRWYVVLASLHNPLTVLLINPSEAHQNNHKQRQKSVEGGVDGKSKGISWVGAGQEKS